MKRLWLLYMCLSVVSEVQAKFQNSTDGIRECDVPIEIHETPDELFRDFFDEDIDELMECRTIDFSKPPQPSPFMVLLRRIGTPLFLHYVTFYVYVRNWVRWLKSKALRREYIPVGSQHYEQL
ncbi:hypothetical protein KC460_02145 [Candidatus Dependentiae bacterium]|nr:hypothetical protein [Candidatus Dependentiae bacterium]